MQKNNAVQSNGQSEVQTTVQSQVHSPVQGENVQIEIHDEDEQQRKGPNRVDRRVIMVERESVSHSSSDKVINLEEVDGKLSNLCSCNVVCLGFCDLK